MTSPGTTATRTARLTSGAIEPYSAQYVDAVGVRRALPEHEDIPPAAGAQRDHLYAIRLDSAAGRFETIRAPRHHPSRRRGAGLVRCYNAVEDGRASSRSRACSSTSALTRTTTSGPNSLQAAIAYAMNNQAEDLMEAGDALRISGDTVARTAMRRPKRVALS